MIDKILWWTGAIAWSLGGFLGIVAGSLYLVGEIAKQLGFWKVLMMGASLYYRQEKQRRKLL